MTYGRPHRDTPHTEVVFTKGEEPAHQLFSENAEMKSVCWCSG